MKFNYHFIFVLFFILSGYASYSQERKILQFSGIVETISSGLPVGYTTITNESFRNEAYMANNEGFFSFVAHVGDTLRFYNTTKLQDFAFLGIRSIPREDEK